MTTFPSKLERRNGIQIYLVRDHPDGTRTVGMWRRTPTTSSAHEGEEWIEWVEPIPQTEKQTCLSK